MISLKEGGGVCNSTGFFSQTKRRESLAPLALVGII